MKAILYCYPRLEGIEEGYLQHIRNRAVLSADGSVPAQKVAEHLALALLEKALVLISTSLGTREEKPSYYNRIYCPQFFSRHLFLKIFFILDSNHFLS